MHQAKKENQMPTLPILQVLFRRNLRTDNEILFGWKALTNTEAKHYNIYHSAKVDGPFVLLKDKILNQPSTQSPYKGKIMWRVLDSQVPIATKADHYFKLTYVNLSDVESTVGDSPIKLVHPPQIDSLDHGQDTDNYVHNFCWDEVNHRWVKGRALFETEYIEVIVGTTEQVVTFDQDICLLEIQNNDMTADIKTNLNGQSIATYGGLTIDPKQYYTAGRGIQGSVGITLVSSAPGTSVTLAGHF